MAQEPIMEFDIKINPEDITTMQANNGEVVFIPFGGTVESKLFSGTVRPGAADVQNVNPAGVRHMRASYIFEGTDCEGNACHLFVENNGYFERGEMKMPFEVTPTFKTDSPALASYLHTARFRSEGYPNPEGVIIKIFDILAE